MGYVLEILCIRLLVSQSLETVDEAVSIFDYQLMRVNLDKNEA